MGKMGFLKKDTKEKKKIDKKWKIVIADDENDVHILTKTVLKNFTYKDRGLEFISTYNTKETIDVVKNNNDIALILLDVVMDSDHAGLNIVKKIRDDIKNDIIQIILRTGQPGYAPEADVVVNYSINDYKEKTELTSKKLFTTIVTALRSYETLQILENSKKGLNKIIKSTEFLFNSSAKHEFMKNILSHLVYLFKLNQNLKDEEPYSGIMLRKEENQILVENTIGKYKDINEFKQLENNLQESINNVIKNKKGTFLENGYIGFLEISKEVSNIIYLSSIYELNHVNKNLIELLFSQTNTAFININLNEEILSTQKIIIEVLGEVVEKRYIDDPNHIKRVAKMSYMLAKLINMSDDEANILKIVSPMHDLGKIGISDSILLKPGKLTEEEFIIMQEHTTIGYEILTGTNEKVLNIAAQVAYEHHERWDGKGYPRKLKGEEISIFGRITSIIDVFDALLSKRCYKDAWKLSEIIEYLEKNKGKQFDPKLTQILLDNIEEFYKVKDMY